MILAFELSSNKKRETLQIAIQKHTYPKSVVHACMEKAYEVANTASFRHAAMNRDSCSPILTCNLLTGQRHFFKGVAHILSRERATVPLHLRSEPLLVVVAGASSALF